ncbi:MAG: 2,3-bisphosphoglycerate-independent phosphoglycerate mutase [Bacteroidales bacterium]|nr:2,3-bisphosphoglycerate-independent phosphoglycerate mutase [Bacteroidales bacterium]MDY4562759.1 2,3-bisphosphoglycerate-independent phosphoglycerate mutase [Candidatus Cryptobacteroides sp.]MDY6171398.1 2,3-bisphosphoglycerate-independent phosphoglycerate mutase [Candidatus Cryptobacteroides sp.]
MERKVLLMILDGWGEGKHDWTNAIYTQGAPYIDSLREKYPFSHLQACGEYVGLPDGQMGNSEVGHLNLGAGRVVYQDLVKINIACRDHKLLENAEIKAAYDYAKANGKALHLMGLASMGGVHSSLAHVYEFLAVAKEYGLEKVFVHCFMDGRDCDPKSGKGFVEELEKEMAGSCGKVASVCGRFYAMDRDKRWDRVKQAYDMLVSGEGIKATSATAAIEASYAEGVTDEFIKPTVITGADGEAVGKIAEGDAVIFFNFRNDRARELTSVLTQQDMPEAGMHTLPLYYCCMTPYDASFKGVHILFPKENVEDTLGETVAKAGKRQLRIAETEKYAHVTFFFNGGREAQFENEDRILVNSPKVPTYDLLPEMSATEVTEKLVTAIQTGKEDMIILNFANGDMVGHTGVYTSICRAVAKIDQCVKKVVEAAISQGYAVLLTADHGNADNAVNPDGTPNTAHSLNTVQFIVINAGDEVKSVKDGKLADVAPTILKLMGIAQPAAMTGEALI